MARLDELDVESLDGVTAVVGLTVGLLDEVKILVGRSNVEVERSPNVVDGSRGVVSGSRDVVKRSAGVVGRAMVVVGVLVPDSATVETV